MATKKKKEENNNKKIRVGTLSFNNSSWNSFVFG